jgi:hypothetical protein
MFSEACQGPEKLMAWYVLIRPCLYKYVILDFSDRPVTPDHLLFSPYEKATALRTYVANHQLVG